MLELLDTIKNSSDASERRDIAAPVDFRDVVAQTVGVSQPSRISTFSDDPDALAQVAGEVEAAARVLLTLSSRAALDLPGSVTLAQLRALAAVDDAGSCTLGALADAVLVSVSSASRMVDRICELGLLDRRQSATNRRELDIRVTPRGKRLLRRHDAARRAVFAEALVGVPNADVRALLRGLRAVQRQLDLRKQSHED